MIKKIKKSTTIQFLKKLMEILSNGHFKEILSWDDDELKFTIYNKQSLQSDVLPLYFKHNNYASFLRQLNIYKFTQFRLPNGNIQFSHPKFTKEENRIIAKPEAKCSKVINNIETNLLIMQQQLKDLIENQQHIVKCVQQLMVNMQILTRQLKYQIKMYIQLAITFDTKGPKVRVFVETFTRAIQDQLYRAYTCNYITEALEVTKEAYSEIATINYNDNLSHIHQSTPWGYNFYSPMPFPIFSYFRRKKQQRVLSIEDEKQDQKVFQKQ